MLAMLAAVVATVGLEPAHAQPGGPPAAKPGKEEGVRWQDLKPAQREALKPLEREWPNIDASRKQKWIGVSSRAYNRLPCSPASLSPQ